MKIIKDKIFKDAALFLDGENDVLLDGCEFTGTPIDADGKPCEAMLMPRNYTNLIIRGCSFHDIIGSGIALRSTGGSIGTDIEYNVFRNIRDNGIIAKAGNYNVSIRRNELYNVGQSPDGKKHPIYVHAPGARITKNLIIGTMGDGITARSSGIISGNRILDTKKSCIRYFSDGKPGSSNTLKIVYNYCHQANNGYAAISLLYSSAGEMVNKIVVKGNETEGRGMAFQADDEFKGLVEWRG